MLVEAKLLSACLGGQFFLKAATCCGQMLSTNVGGGLCKVAAPARARYLIEILVPDGDLR